MNKNVLNYYRRFTETQDPSGHFLDVIDLNQSPDIGWEQLLCIAPHLTKGWYELSRLDTKDRIEFTRDYWMAQLPYIPHVFDFINIFFENLDDVGIYLTKKKQGGSDASIYDAHLVYSICGDSSFFHGTVPATEKEIQALSTSFKGLILPEDYLAFLSIHRGFGKYADTGLIDVRQIRYFYDVFQEFVKGQDVVWTSHKIAVNTKGLIPFYVSHGHHCYQCFWQDWYPAQEMGNVYYSAIDNSISDIHQKNWLENQAFPTFLEWLTFYLECVD